LHDNRFFGATKLINQFYFLCLETKKVNKENSRLKIILGLLVLRLARAIQLAMPGQGLA
jgi:hypothetical protein